ncbi:MAG: glucose-6-phosphate dehydrogenase [Candidatus Brocadiae bacterium]|nr:glucose-6-phosphate dehydrogenase [Candidatus Brocadiia bacterium]
MEKISHAIFVLFGASGDLAKRMVVPALFRLFCQGFLPQNFQMLGVSRSFFEDDAFRKSMAEGLEKFARGDSVSLEKQKEFLSRICYFPIEYSQPKAYFSLKEKLESMAIGKEKNYFFYLSTPPLLFEEIAINLGNCGLNLENEGKRTIVVEKPFGYDLESAKRLNKRLLSIFQESQIYRIDHYLGKETVQNLLFLRFANGIFEPLWNREYVHHIEITSAEFLGVENRGGYYDGSGILRDMVQNHLLQMLALVAMEPPCIIESNAIRNETLKVFQSLHKMSHQEILQNTVRGQYTSSFMQGEKFLGYREEKGVSDESRTETFAALRFYIDNWRWAGVPFYIRAGKRMPTRVTEVVIHYKPAPLSLFTRGGLFPGNMDKEALCETCNQLVLRIQPDEGILLKINMKVPGRGFVTQKINMGFYYKELANAYIPTAYERLILDCLEGDSTLFSRADAVETCWEFITPILKAWEGDEIKLYGYPCGTWGPQEANSIFEDKAFGWRYPCKNLASDGLYCEL